MAPSVPGEPGAGRKSTRALLAFSVSLHTPHAFVNARSGAGLGLACNASKLLPPVPQTMDVSPPATFVPVLSRVP